MAPHCESVVAASINPSKLPETKSSQPVPQWHSGRFRAHLPRISSKLAVTWSDMIASSEQGKPSMATKVEGGVTPAFASEVVQGPDTAVQLKREKYDKLAELNYPRRSLKAARNSIRQAARTLPPFRTRSDSSSDNRQLPPSRFLRHRASLSTGWTAAFATKTASPIIGVGESQAEPLVYNLQPPPNIKLSDLVPKPDSETRWRASATVFEKKLPWYSQTIANGPGTEKVSKDIELANTATKSQEHDVILGLQPQHERGCDKRTTAMPNPVVITSLSSDFASDTLQSPSHTVSQFEPLDGGCLEASHALMYLFEPDEPRTPRSQAAWMGEANLYGPQLDSDQDSELGSDSTSCRRPFQRLIGSIRPRRGSLRNALRKHDSGQRSGRLYRPSSSLASLVLKPKWPVGRSTLSVVGKTTSTPTNGSGSDSKGSTHSFLSRPWCSLSDTQQSHHEHIAFPSLGEDLLLDSQCTSPCPRAFQAHEYLPQSSQFLGSTPQLWHTVQRRALDHQTYSSLPRAQSDSSTKNVSTTSYTRAGESRSTFFGACYDEREISSKKHMATEVGQCTDYMTIEDQCSFLNLPRSKIPWDPDAIYDGEGWISLPPDGLTASSSQFCRPFLESRDTRSRL